VRPRAQELGCTDELALLPDLIRRDGGAGRQRALHAIGGMDTLLRELTRVTSS
jgi:carboxylate-amine ligase